MYFMVCDDCQEVLRPIAEHPYEPHFVDRLARTGDHRHGPAPQPA